MFHVEFEVEDRNPLSFGTIDFHIDKNFTPSRKIAIFDGHGLI